MCFLSGFTDSRFVSNHSLLGLKKSILKTGGYAEIYSEIPLCVFKVWRECFGLKQHELQFSW